MDTNKKNYLKFTLALIFCLLARLIPLRAPNIEPILATTMPISRVYGAALGSLFAVLSVLFYDIVTGTMGLQTFFTLFAYGIIGLWSAHYFKNNKSGTWGYIRFAVMGTLFFDAATGLTAGPIFFHQSFAGALAGQIPFTALHLLGNVAFAFILSPAIYNFLIRKKKKEKGSIINLLNPKAI